MDAEDVKYFTMPEEMFARAYTQWIATRSGDTELLRSLTSQPEQWAEDDFEQIASAFDRLFASRQLES